MLQHIALTINYPEEIKNFYEDILLCNIQHKFPINEDVAGKIFNVKLLVDVYVMSHKDVQFEIFVSSEKEKKVFSHICLANRDAKITYKKAAERDYKVLIKKNPVSDTYFIWDKSGNMFEIKEIAN